MKNLVLISTASSVSSDGGKWFPDSPTGGAHCHPCFAGSDQGLQRSPSGGIVSSARQRSARSLQVLQTDLQPIRDAESSTTALLQISHR